MIMADRYVYNFGEVRFRMSEFTVQMTRYMNTYFAAMKKDAHEFRKQIDDTPHDEKPSYADEALDELENVYPRIFLNSCFFTSFSYLEQMLDRTSEIARTYLNLRIKPQDFQGGTLEKFRIFFDKVLNCDLKKSEPFWVQLAEFNKIRNYLVHQGEGEESKFNAIKGLAPKYPSIEMNVHYLQVSIKDEKFITQFLKTSGDYISEILNAIVDRMEADGIDLAN